jgi:hypothetical protein
MAQSEALGMLEVVHRIEHDSFLSQSCRCNSIF